MVVHNTESQERVFVHVTSGQQHRQDRNPDVRGQLVQEARARLDNRQVPHENNFGNQTVGEGCQGETIRGRN